MNNKEVKMNLRLKELIERNIIIKGITERRSISKIKVNSDILKNIFNMYGSKKISFNLMMITIDHKVLLLQRTESFHFPKVIKDLKLNKINFNLLESLYTSELEKIRNLFFDFLPPPKSDNTKIIHIFPGGQSSYNEKVLLTLLRELYEETSINITVKDLKFNQSYIFNVSIYDFVVKKNFNNFIFPVKVNMSSQEISQNFKETKHTRNPTFIDICDYKSLFDAFVQVQHFMLL